MYWSTSDPALDQHCIWNEWGFRPLLCTYTGRLNWSRRPSWGWWDEWDDTASRHRIWNSSPGGLRPTRYLSVTEVIASCVHTRQAHYAFFCKSICTYIRIALYIMRFLTSNTAFFFLSVTDLCKKRCLCLFWGTVIGLWLCSNKIRLLLPPHWNYLTSSCSAQFGSCRS